MGKLTREQENRMSGMNYALKIAEKEGVDALRKNIQMRGALGIGLLIDNKRLDEAYHIMSRTLYETVVLTALMSLVDLGYGEKRLRRFMDAFDRKTEDLMSIDRFGERFVTFQDMSNELKRKYKIDLTGLGENRVWHTDERSPLNNIIELLEDEGYYNAVKFLRGYTHDEIARGVKNEKSRS